MKFSSCEDFNDPFDCVVAHDVEGSIQYALSRRDLFEQAKRQVREAIVDETVMISNLRKSLEAGYFAQNMVSEFGICSLSSDYKNILMWSHYADNHKGFVVEFESPKKFNGYLTKPEYLLISWPVEYKNDMPIVTMGQKEGFESVKEQFLVKASDWKYEKEHRCLAHESGPGIHSFHPSILKGIIAGSKMTETNFNELRELITAYELAHNVKITLKRAVNSKSKYELEFV